MPFAAALATGLPLLAGVFSTAGLWADLVARRTGVLYLPQTPLYHRMVTMMACAFAMAACYTLG